jgi:hypothetical protein
MVSFTPRQLYSPGKSPRYPLDRSLGGTQSRSGRGGEEKNPCPFLESNSGRPACIVVTMLTELPDSMKKTVHFFAVLVERENYSDVTWAPERESLS